jgi:hypothetical protein
MPSINEVIARVSLVRPDVYPDESKGQWLCELDGKLKREVILRHKLTAGRGYRGAAVICPKCRLATGLEYNPHLDMSRCSCGWDSGPDIPQSYPEDGDEMLLVQAPYDNLYDLYLAAQADFFNRENDNYNDSVTLYEQARKEWQRRYHQEHLPVSAMDAEDWRKVVV